MTSLPKIEGLTAYEVCFRVVEQRSTYVFATSPERAIARVKNWHEDEGAAEYLETAVISTGDWDASEVLS
jgi:hypothetical protein